MSAWPIVVLTLLLIRQQAGILRATLGGADRRLPAAPAPQ